MPRKGAGPGRLAGDLVAEQLAEPVGRVIEFGRLPAGPFCGRLLGDFGAEVIKDTVRDGVAAAGPCRSATSW